VVEKGTVIPRPYSKVELFRLGTPVRSFGRDQSDRRARAVTDLEGGFEIENLEKGDYRLRVHGWPLTHWVEVKVGGASSLATRIELESGVTATIFTRDEGDYGVQNAYAVWRDGDGRIVRLPSAFDLRDSSDSTYLLEPGRYEVTVLHPRFAPQRFPLVVGEQPVNLYRTLRRGGGIEMTVRRGESPVAGASVQLLDQEGRDYFEDRVPYPELIVANPIPAPSTDSNGNLRVEHLGTGAWRVVVQHGDRRVERGVHVLWKKETKVEIDLDSE
ncbi:MAG: hypothetical protein AAF517_22600, partial [Planctomycetota bacterium]